MMTKLSGAYQSPNCKFAFFTAKNDAAFGRILGIENWDWTPQPTINVEPYFGNTHTLALAMGCRARHTSEGKEWIQSMINDPAQVKEIEIPDPLDGRTGEIIEDIEDLLLEAPENVLIRLPDIQSPLGVAELMWNPETFYSALLSNPVEVHELLDKITQFIIAYVQEIQAILDDRLNPACFPEIWSDPAGYYIADDSNSLVSPAMHLEYGVHYINQITAACGPVHYHSCTWNRPYFANIRKINNIKAVNWAVNTSDDPAVIIDEFSGDYLLCPHIGADAHDCAALSMHGFRDEAELVEFMLNAMRQNTSLYFWFQPELVQKTEVMMRIYQLFKNHGYLPPVQ
ncbi:MAG: hypothetical protein EHM72_14725 [Calditrichaeota bacterium]|nr:MAG: hypothetical protein EHM72_14725 [Calditrichota bacterium]